MQGDTGCVATTVLVLLLAVGCRGAGDADAGTGVADAGAGADGNGAGQCAEGETPCWHNGPWYLACCDPESVCCGVGSFTALGGPGSLCYPRDAGCPPTRSCPFGLSCPEIPGVVCSYTVLSSGGEIDGHCRLMPDGCGDYGLPCGDAICCERSSMLCLDGGCALQVP